MAPLSAFGHGLEFLTAELTLLPDYQVQLEVTADYAGNPLIPDEAEAREALRNPLHVQLGHGWVPLAALARESVTVHTDWDSCAPPSLPLPPSDAEHALVTATWRWRHAEDSVTFMVPKGNLHDVFLWQGGVELSSELPQWMLLLAGDVTKKMPLKGGAGWRWPAAFLACGLIAGVAFWSFRRRHQQAI